MIRSRPARPLALAALAAAALLLFPAAPASARAPSTADQGAMDWLLLRLAKDREEENKGGTVLDPVAAFARGDVPLDGEGGWKAMLAVIYSPTEKAGRKAEAAQAIADRFKLEDERRAKVEEDRRAAEVKALRDAKVLLCRETLSQRGMLSSNTVVLACVLKIQKSLLPPEWVTWKDSDNLKTRRKAYDDLAKRLK